MRILMLGVVVMLAGPVMAATTERKPQSCLDNRSIGETRFSGDEGYFARSGKGWWQNKARGCRLLAEDRSIQTVSTINRQCRGDQVLVFHNFSRIEFGACVLEDWVPVETAAVPPARNRPAPGRQ